MFWFYQFSSCLGLAVIVEVQRLRMLNLYTFILVVLSPLLRSKGSLQILHWLWLLRLHGQLIYYAAASIFFFIFRLS